MLASPEAVALFAYLNDINGKDRANSHVTEVHSSHSVTVSHPDVVADVIIQAAVATTELGANLKC